MSRLYFLPWVVFGLVWLVSALFSRRTVRSESWLQRLTYVAPLGLGSYLLCGSWTLLGQRLIPESLAPLGLVMTCAGIAFAFWARFHLGRLWSGNITLKEEHKLVQSGPYGLARHPIYTGILLALLGSAVSMGTLRALLGMVMVVAAFVSKLSREEALMAEHFGDVHRDYRARVKRLVPFLW